METNSEPFKGLDQNCYSKFEGGLEYFNEPFDIKPVNRLTVFRFFLAERGPFTFAKWDTNAKAVRSNSGSGMFGLFDNQLLFECISSLPDQGLTIADVSVLQLEVDKEHVLQVTNQEICFTQCNIIHKYTLEEYTEKHFPQGLNIINRFRSITSYGSMRISEIRQLMDFYNDEKRQFRFEWNEWKRKYFSDPYLFLHLPWLKKLALKTCQSSLHGADHMERVDRNGQLLTEGSKIVLDSVVRIFAYIHDMCRSNDGNDPEHGARAAQMVDYYQGNFFCIQWFSDDEREKLKFACTHHSTMLRSGDPTIDACFDAERLDLARRGIVLNPELMATEKGATFAADPELFKKAVERFNTSNNSKRANDLEHWGIFATQLASK